MWCNAALCVVVRAEMAYWKGKVDSVRDDTKKTWHTINSLTGESCKPSHPLFSPIEHESFLNDKISRNSQKQIRLDSQYILILRTSFLDLKQSPWIMSDLSPYHAQTNDVLLTLFLQYYSHLLIKDSLVIIGQFLTCNFNTSL